MFPFYSVTTRLKNRSQLHRVNANSYRNCREVWQQHTDTISTEQGRILDNVLSVNYYMYMYITSNKHSANDSEQRRQLRSTMEQLHTISATAALLAKCLQLLTRSICLKKWTTRAIGIDNGGGHLAADKDAFTSDTSFHTSNYYTNETQQKTCTKIMQFLIPRLQRILPPKMPFFIRQKV